MGKLRDQMLVDLQLCGAKPRTQESYLREAGKSDAAWLETLVDLPQAQILSQVEWLGRVLGNRGMPRVTLERQLELLHDELTAAVPGKIDQYKGLLEASASLKADRDKYDSLS